MKRPLLKCESCGQEFPAARFCSLPCAHKAQRHFVGLQQHGEVTHILFANGQVGLIDTVDVGFVSDLLVGIKKDRAGREYIRVGRQPNDEPLHQLILGPPPDGHLIDHRNGNGLDNRRRNLRFANNSQNMANARKSSVPKSSRFKGVHWHKCAKKWCAAVVHHGRRKHLGLFAVEEDAARAYDKAALEHFGEFARLNFPHGNRNT